MWVNYQAVLCGWAQAATNEGTDMETDGEDDGEDEDKEEDI
jgi:hypothetical protein